ncbi:MAG TPA: ABC transporter permease, partial [Cyclobacteriaceae bacterium]|nr:ABC transporter permease [Cyclobacteriaceae bacterium]
MFKNILTVAVRSFLRQKTYSIINVAGLASGLTCVLFIYLWVNDEISKDKFHRDGDKIFRVLSTLRLGDGEVLTWTNTPGPLAEDIREKNPEVEFAVRVVSNRSDLFQYEDRSFLETGCIADPDFFKLFSFTILHGMPNTDTADISSISISQRLAHKLFGNDDPIGKMVKVNSRSDYTIAAIFEDVGPQSSLTFDYVIPYEVYRKQRGEGFNWNNYDHPTYLKLYDAAQAQQAVDKINERRLAFARAQGDSSGAAQFYMQPFSDSYLYAHFENGKPAGGRIKYVKIFAVVALFILVIACINFMNMATARAVNRAKEVGVRKVVGAQRKSLIFQFISESMLVSLLCMMLAIFIAYMLLPLFNILVAKQISISFSDTLFWISALAMVCITGILAGVYPAFFLSSYQPAQTLKSSAVPGGGGSLRKALVVFQFTLTVILVASSMVIYNQVNFIFNKNIGYSRESVLSFPLRGA